MSPGVQLFCGQLFQHRLTFFDDPTGYAHAYRRKVIPKRKSQHAGNRPCIVRIIPMARRE